MNGFTHEMANREDGARYCCLCLNFEPDGHKPNCEFLRLMNRAARCERYSLATLLGVEFCSKAGARIVGELMQDLKAKVAEARAAADTNAASLDQCEARARVLLEEGEKARADLAAVMHGAIDEARATSELHRVALAAAQAQVVALREAFKKLAEVCLNEESLHNHDDYDTSTGECPEDDTCECSNVRLINDTLAQPADDAALRALLDAERAKMAAARRCSTCRELCDRDVCGCSATCRDAQCKQWRDADDTDAAVLKGTP